MSKLIETKSLLAKLMATENIHIEQRKVATASFDLDSRVLTVPILNDNIDADTYDLFMGHEVGHALYTNFYDWKKAYEDKENMSVLNVVEDFRIEKKIKYKYPGLKNVFVRAYNGLFSNNFFKTDGEDLNEYNFIDRINLHHKVGASLNIQFNDKEREILKDLDTIQTFDDAVRMQRVIVEYMKSEKDDEEMDEMSLPDLDDVMTMEMSTEELEIDGEDGEGEDKDDSGVSDDSNSDEEKESKDDSESEENSKGDSETNEKEESEQSQSETNEKDAGAGNEEIRSLTDDAFKQNEHRLFDAKKMESLYMNVPKVNLDELIIDFKTLYTIFDNQFTGSYYSTETEALNAFAPIRNSLNKSVSYLVKEFELRKNAEQMKKASTAKTGDLNMSRIYSYQFNEDIFKKLTVTNQGKSHGLVMFVDWSGSMVDHLFNTMKQLFSIVMFCKKVNIPFEVYAFTDQFMNINKPIQDRHKNDVVISTQLRLLNILSSRMNASQFTKAANALTFVAKTPHHSIPVFTLGGTPLNDTILTAMDIVPEFKRKNNLQIVNTVILTDGESNGTISYCDSNFRENNARVYYGYGSMRDMVFRDTVSKHEVKVPHDASTADITAAYIKLLKYRTNSNIIGFYILSNHEVKRKIYSFFPKQYHLHDGMYNQFKKTQHLVVTNQGYDEYYLLKSDKITDEEEEFETSAKTAKALTNAFVKFANNKSNSKTVLNRFIGLIS